MNACQGASAKVSPGPLALGVPQEAEEVDRVAGRREVEAQAAPSGRGEIVEMALAGQADQAVGRQDRAFGDRLSRKP